MVFPLAFDVKRIEKSAEYRGCAPGQHVSSGRGTIVGRLGRIMVYDTCQRCGQSYERAPNEEEMKRYEEIMKTEFII